MGVEIGEGGFLFRGRADYGIDESSVQGVMSNLGGSLIGELLLI